MSVRPLCAGIAASLAIAGLGAGSGESSDGQILDGRLTARPAAAGGGACVPGTHTLKLGSGRTALMRVNAGASAGKKALVLALHGAGGSPEGGLWAFRGGWRTPGLVLLAPASESRTWNVFHGSDLDTIDRALRRAFARCRIDSRRIAIGGFSDGATTALSLGLLNGDLFRAVMALAPGGIIAENPVGKPRVFIAHGTRDTVLPIRISEAVVRELRSFGYSVTLRRFAGGHDVPEGISRAALRWFLRT